MRTQKKKLLHKAHKKEKFARKSRNLIISRALYCLIGFENGMQYFLTAQQFFFKKDTKYNMILSHNSSFRIRIYRFPQNEHRPVN